MTAQLESALHGAARRARRAEQRQMNEHGNAAGIRVPYERGGQNAMGPAKAARQLVAALLQDPETVGYVRERLDLDTVPEDEIRLAIKAVYDLADAGQPVNATSLQSALQDEKAYNLAMQVQAENADQRLQRQDVDMYLERLRRATPMSSRAAQTDDDGFRQLFANIRREKHADAPPGH